jgi:nitrogen fixation/metabolism regulation signal transduction histidine kinase
LRGERHTLSEANRFYEAVLDDAPTALLTVDHEGKVELTNKAARRLLVKHKGVRAEDFAVYGDAFAGALSGGAVGRPRLVPLLTDGLPQTVMVSAAIVQRLGGLVRVVAVQPIQGELNAVEIAAQSDLIRVLTHEIMNSITPVTSLAHTAADLIASVDCGGDTGDRGRALGRGDAGPPRRRGDELRRKLPPDQPRAAGEAAQLRSASLGAGAGDNLPRQRRRGGRDPDRHGRPAVAHHGSRPDLLCQVLINLLRNAADAARSHSEQPAVSLTVQFLPTGEVQIDVADNGPGVPEGLRADVFLPFFTTKASGTGVGLSLARQVVLAHRGSIAVTDAHGGGALFRMVI